MRRRVALNLDQKESGSPCQKILVESGLEGEWLSKHLDTRNAYYP